MNQPQDQSSARALLTVEESVERVASMLDGAIRPWMVLLADGTIEAHLAVDPDIAWAALRGQP